MEVLLLGQALLGEFTHEIIITAMISCALGLLMWPFRAAKKEWNAAKSKLDAVQAELALQRTNCLSTLQDQGEKQVKLLEKTVETLEAMHLDQRTLLGRLDK